MLAVSFKGVFMSVKIRVAAGTLAALALMAYSGSAWAVWVEKSDSWCKKHGFNPPCEVWEKTATPANANPARLPAIREPKVGEVRAKTARTTPATPARN